MGPAPGIRWKSGAPPAPPKYTADAKEVGSFDRYSRRVRLWAKRASGWMTDGDAALLLVESLSGAAERELEFTPLVEIENGGVEFALQQLEASSNEHLVYRKHHYLRQWETVRRKVGETMRAYPRQSFVPHNVVHGLFVLDFSPSWRNAFFIKNSRFFTLKSCLSQLGLLRFLLTVLEPSRSFCICYLFFLSIYAFLIHSAWPFIYILEDPLG